MNQNLCYNNVSGIKHCSTEVYNITFSQYVNFKYYFACCTNGFPCALFNENICSFKENMRLTST